MPSRRGFPLLLAVCVLALAASACSLEIAGPADPMVVVDGQGRVVTIDRHGEESMVLGDEDDAFQPVWAPDGDLVAYATRDPESPELVVASRNGRSTWRVGTESPPFYLSWAPGSSRLGILRNGDEGEIAFEVVRMRDEGEDLIVRPADSGAPYYFSWGLSADILVSHVDNESLGLVAADTEAGGEVTPLDVEPALFQAPQWTERGIFTFARGDDGDQVMLIDTRTRTLPLLDVETPGWLSVSPDGDRLAAQTAVDPGSVITASAPVAPVSQDEVPHLASGIGVVDLDSGELEVVSPTPVAAFFWSPDSSSLLMLSPTGGPGGARWSVWTDGETVDGPEFTAAPTWLAEMVPFFDQYARSMSLWSPDSDAFAFPGTIDGQSGIWVHDLETGETSYVIDGDWVAWAPVR